MIVSELIKEAKDYLLKRDIDDAGRDVYILAEDLLNMDRRDILLNPNKHIEDELTKKFIESVKLRGNHIPIQHITGHQEFMGIDFEVNENVLIPRFDTEILVEQALSFLSDRNDNVDVLDMCTGSGCIAITVDKMCSNATVDACDISPKALAVAKKNNEKNHCDVNFIESDLFENITKKYDLFLSNPPYIETEEIKKLDAEVKLHDPMLALDGHEDGLFFYKKIIGKLPMHLKDGAKAIFEIGYNQSAAVESLLKDNDFINVITVKDLAGLDRVVMGDYKII